MAQATDLTACSATELLQLYRTGQASPVEAALAVHARIERLNPQLNAFCFVDPDRSLAAVVIRRGLTVEVPKHSSVLLLTFEHPDAAVVQPRTCGRLTTNCWRGRSAQA